MANHGVFRSDLMSGTDVAADLVSVKYMGSGTAETAIDKACVDLIYSSKDKGRDHFVERIETRHGTHTIDAAYELKFGNKEYELIEIK